MKRLALLLAIAAMFCVPGMASADFYLTDLGYYDNYPDQGQPLVSIDKIVAGMTSGSVLFTSVGPGMINYGSGFNGWTAVNSPGNSIVTATNALAPTSANWNYQWAGSMPTSGTWSLTWNGYNNGTFVVGEHLTFSGGTLISGNYFYDRPASVPIPGALLLFAPGLAGLALLRRRFTI